MMRLIPALVVVCVWWVLHLPLSALQEGGGVFVVGTLQEDPISYEECYRDALLIYSFEELGWVERDEVELHHNEYGFAQLLFVGQPRICLAELIAFFKSQLDPNRLAYMQGTFISLLEDRVLCYQRYLQATDEESGLIEGLLQVDVEDLKGCLIALTQELESVLPSLEEVGVDTCYAPFYNLPLTHKDCRRISKLIYQLSSYSYLKLMSKYFKIEKLGEQIRRSVHPIRFLGYIFSNPELRDGMRKIRKKSIKWKPFVKGLDKQLKKEDRKDNVIQYLPGLCQLLGIEEHLVRSHIEYRDTRGLLNCLIEYSIPSLWGGEVIPSDGLTGEG